jgi:hypothetical protein
MGVNKIVVMIFLGSSWTAPKPKNAGGGSLKTPFRQFWRKLPFMQRHIRTGWKFQETYESCS